MSETKWIIRGGTAGGFDVVSVFETGEYVVARDMPIEDALMIAAAPDLYAALEKLADACDASDAWISDDILTAARAALSRARGETT